MGEREMEGEDSVRRVDCLRGRLLAERAASRNAREEAQQLEHKLMELEKLLKQEAKSRKRAEKKLGFLTKKLESINISDESQHSELMNKTDISSISSSTPSTITKQKQETHQESKGKATSHQKELGNLDQIDAQNCSFSLSDCSSTAEAASISSAFEALLPEFKDLECETRCDRDEASPRTSKILEQRFATFEDSLSEESSLNMDQQSDFCCPSFRSSADDSMALVLFNTPQSSRRIDPDALDDTVREVLHTLKRAKEQLRSSMERRRMNVMRVGEANLRAKTSTIFI